MGFDGGEAALRYHEATKHSELTLRMSAHYLDWNNKPSPFKAYKNLPSIPLPHEFPHPTQESLRTIKSQDSLGTSRPVDLQKLAEILFFSGGITRKMRIGSETHYMRAASATGALYPIELYVVSFSISGLDAGVYHFNPLGFSLAKIRDGDYSSKLGAITREAARSSSATIVLTSLAWRNAWKYEARSYRHWFWDAGVMAANLLATCYSETVPARILMGFIDKEVDQLLGLRQEQEATVALATIGQRTTTQDKQEPTEVSQLSLEDEPLSKEEVEYPVIWETNRASELHSEAEIGLWRNSLKPGPAIAGPHGPTFPLRPSVKNSPPLEEVVLRRGSTRRFAQKSISFEALSTIIDAATSPLPLDFLSNDDSLTEFYFIANDVDELPPGAYYFDRGTKSLEQLKEGKLRYVSGYLCLEQLLFSDASVVFFLMTDLYRVLEPLGSRGYRAAEFEAGLRAGKIYLSAYALGIGASGSTFYDDAVTEFFSPHSRNMSPMIAVGAGVPAYSARPGRILPQFEASHKSRKPKTV